MVRSISQNTLMYVITVICAAQILIFPVPTEQSTTVQAKGFDAFLLRPVEGIHCFML